MRNHLLAAGAAAALLVPSFAMAQTSCEQQHHDRVVGTVAGAGLGALIGGAVAGRHDRGAGAVIGGLGGAVAGNQLSRPNADCAHAYGYYDRSGAWHANGVERSAAQGYFDRNGAWVDGAPNGYYDSHGRWLTGGAAAQARGGYDQNGHWVPAAATGYYDSHGRWYDNASRSNRYRTETSFENRRGQAIDTRTREAWMDHRIHAGLADGSLSRREGYRGLRVLRNIRQQDSRMSRFHGQLSQRDDQRIQARLDALGERMRLSR